MLVSNQPYWPRAFRQIARPLLADVAFAIAVTILTWTGHPIHIFAVPDLPVSLFGAALGILLGFRTNSAYDRWWEARTLWGGLVNSSRTLARQSLAFIKDDYAARELVRYQIAYVYALRCHLRQAEPWHDLSLRLPADFVANLRKEQNVPAALLHVMGQGIEAMAEQGKLSELRLQRLDQTLTDLTNIQGGCERIRNTPLPRQYDYYPELFIYVYTFLFPLAIVQETGWVTPIVTALIAMVFLILNRIGKNLEDPFDSTIYGTPMLALSRTIEINLLQQLGDTGLPPSIRPRMGVLP